MAATRLFGTSNQLADGLALTVVAVWVLRMKWNPIPAVVPPVFLLAPLDGVIFLLAIWLVVEAVMALRAGADVQTNDEMGSPVRDSSTPAT